MEPMPVFFTIIVGQADNENKDKNNGQCTMDKIMDLNERMVHSWLSVSQAFSAPVVQNLCIRSLFEGGISNVDHPVGWDEDNGKDKIDNARRMEAVRALQHGAHLDMLVDQPSPSVEPHGVMVGESELEKWRMDEIEDNGPPLHDDKDKK